MADKGGGVGEEREPERKGRKGKESQGRRGAVEEEESGGGARGGGGVKEKDEPGKNGSQGEGGAREEGKQRGGELAQRRQLKEKDTGIRRTTALLE